MLSPTHQSTATIPIYKVDSLLQIESKQTVLNQIQLLFPAAVYRTLYLPAIKQFAKAAQSLPVNTSEKLVDFGDLLECGLTRAHYTLVLALEHLLPNQKDFYSLFPTSDKAYIQDDKVQLELYAVFTAALFLEVHQVITEYHVMLYGLRLGKPFPIQVWNPFLNLMEEGNASAYLFQKLEPYLPRFPHLVNGALAISILNRNSETQQALAYLMKDLKIWADWLAILAGEEDHVATSPVMSLIPFANKMLVDKHLEHSKLPLRSGGIFANTSNETSEETRILGENFLKWIRNRITKGDVLINQAEAGGVLRVKQGVLISRDLLEQFSQEKGLDSALVEKQFHQVVALYPSSLNERARQSSAFGGVAQASLEQWLVAYNPALVFGLSGRGMPAIYQGNLNPILNTLNKIMPKML